MNEEIKAKWINALRAGNYQQGMGGLKRSTKGGGAEFCCLGVLCEIAVQEGIIPPAVSGKEMGYPINEDNPKGVRYYYGKDRATGHPPKEVVEWAGMCSNPTSSMNMLIYLNDTEGYTFKQIADWIEANDVA